MHNFFFFFCIFLKRTKKQLTLIIIKQHISRHNVQKKKKKLEIDIKIYYTHLNILFIFNSNDKYHIIYTYNILFYIYVCMYMSIIDIAIFKHTRI